MVIYYEVIEDEHNGLYYKCVKYELPFCCNYMENCLLKHNINGYYCGRYMRGYLHRWLDNPKCPTCNTVIHFLKVIETNSTIDLTNSNIDDII